MNITITGDIGSGKSTIAKQLAKELSMEVVEAGELYRQYAATKGLDVLQQNKSDDWSIDKEIDSKIESMGQSEDGIIFVSRMAWHFVPDAIKIYLSINPMLAAERVVQDVSRQSERHSKVFDTYLYNMERKDKELRRYKELYSVEDPSGGSNSDIVIVVGNNTIEDVCACLKWALETRTYGTYIDPKVLLPTQTIRDMNMGIIEDYRHDIPENKTVVPLGITVVHSNGLYYIIDGHHRVAATIINADKFVHVADVSAGSADVSSSTLFDWEDMLHTDLSKEIATLDIHQRRSEIRGEAYSRNMSYDDYVSYVYSCIPSIHQTDNEEESVISYWNKYKEML